jgi:hypothetical protein
MNIRSVNEAKRIYEDWFASTMSKEAIHVAMDVTKLAQLETFRETISAGEYDAIEAELRGVK